jgi:hypothetical protein
MKLATTHLPRHFRAFAAMMLGVWLVSQSFCVAHCHGVLSGGRQSPTGLTQSSHGCCARSKSSRGIQTDGTAIPASRLHHASQDPGSNNSESPSPANPCSPQAVIQGGLNLEAPTWAPVLLPFPQNSAGSEFCGAAVFSWYHRTAAIQPHRSDPAIPRWDAGFEPSVILGSGLRSLAPPIGVG